MPPSITIHEPPIRFEILIPAQPILGPQFPGPEPPRSDKIHHGEPFSVAKVQLEKNGVPGIVFTTQNPPHSGEYTHPRFIPASYAVPTGRISASNLSRLGVEVPDDLMFPPPITCPTRNTYDDRVDTYVDKLRQELMCNLHL